MFCALLALIVPATARAGAVDPLSAYIEYDAAFGDTYNGVTTDDGDHLFGSYATKARLDYGPFDASFRYHSDISRSKTNSTTPSGAPGTVLTYPAGQTIVPLFNAIDSESEVRLTYRPARLPIWIGLAYSHSSNNYNFPSLQAVGYGIELQPSQHRRLSPFGSYFFFPNQIGTYALANPNNPNSGSAPAAYRSNELEFGAAFAFARSPISVVAGYSQTTNISRFGAFNFVRDGPFIGVGFRVR